MHADMREGARRQHRMIGLYAMVQCWAKGLDGMFITRRQLERLLGISRFRMERLAWLKEDIRGFFPICDHYVKLNTETFHSLLVSRRRFDDETAARKAGLLGDLMLWTDIDRALPKTNPKHSLHDIFETEFENAHARFLSTCLALISQGLLDASSLMYSIEKHH
jgi:hypothetical protein